MGKKAKLVISRSQGGGKEKTEKLKDDTLLSGRLREKKVGEGEAAAGSGDRREGLGL